MASYIRATRQLLQASDRSMLRSNITRASSLWSHVEMGPPDAIFGIVEACKNDPNPNKINLSTGVYRGNDEKPYVLASIKKAERIVVERNLDKEYAGLVGNPDFRKLAGKLALGPHSKLVDDNLVSTFQTISGTGALSLGGAFLARCYPHSKSIYIPDPSWPNHGPVMTRAGLDVKSFRYYDKETRKLNMSGMLEDIANLPNQSILLFHACAHNPTGLDPSMDQWKDISEAIKRKDHYLFFDMAYQGFATGDLDRDGAAFRLFIENGHNVCLAQSFAKNMGLYGERVGAFSVFCSSPEERDRIESQIKLIVRPTYSNAPIHGARIAVEVMTNPELHAEWLVELQGMADRLRLMRTSLRENLEKLGSSHDWSHVTNQIGMFAYSGLNPQQVEKITKEFSVYLTKDGRMSVTGMTTQNIENLAIAMHEVTK